MKLLFLWIGIGVTFSISAQITIDNSKDFIEITDTVTPLLKQSDTIIFYGSLPGMEKHHSRYNNELLRFGLHFKNHQKNILWHTILPEPEPDSLLDEFHPSWHSSPLLGVHGKGTEVYYTGPMLKGDNTYCYTSIVLMDQGRFVIGKEATIDLIFPRYGNFTRQIWVYSDGTGIFELEEGFTADKSKGGKTNNACGSIRLSNVHFVTHSSESLPYYYKPDRYKPGLVNINSHLVFENEKGSVWHVKTNPQKFIGGVWIFEDAIVNTQKKLELAGVISEFSDYINYGGLMFKYPGRQLTKKGKSWLVISGPQIYAARSRLKIAEGGVELQSDPYNGSPNVYPWINVQNGQHLTVQLQPETKLKVTGVTAHFDTLALTASSCHMDVKMNSVVYANHAQLNGTLTISIPGNSINYFQKQPRQLKVFEFEHQAGKFEKIDLSDERFDADISEFYSKGIISISPKYQKQ